MEEYCGGSYGKYYEYGDTQTVTIESPANVDLPEELKKRNKEIQISEPYIGVIQNARLIGKYPIAITPDYKVIIEATVSPVVSTLNIVYSLVKLAKTRKFDSVSVDIGSAVLLYNAWNGGYWHWVVEGLTRLEGAEYYEQRTGERPKIIVGPDLTSFQQESLKLLGYEEEDLIYWDNLHGNVDRLIVPSVGREVNPQQASPVSYKWLRDRMLKAATSTEEDKRFSPYIYISRQDAVGRRVKNEEELLRCVSKYGFERYKLSELTVEENIKLFRQAEVIIAPHGAGLTDMIYSDDITIIELFRKDDLDGRTVYYVLARQLGHKYVPLLCNPIGPDLVVDIDELKKLLKSKII